MASLDTHHTVVLSTRVMTAREGFFLLRFGLLKGFSMNFAYLTLKCLFPIYLLLRGGGPSRRIFLYLLRSLTDSISVYFLTTFLPLVFLYENRLFKIAIIKRWGEVHKKISIYSMPSVLTFPDFLKFIYLLIFKISHPLF